jgi:hypothetical protein
LTTTTDDTDEVPARARKRRLRRRAHLKSPHAFLPFLKSQNSSFESVETLRQHSTEEKIFHFKKEQGGNRLAAGRVLLEDLLDNLLLLDQEGTDDAVLDAVGAAGTTVGTLDGLLGARDGSVLAGTEGGNLKRDRC